MDRVRHQLRLLFHGRSTAVRLIISYQKSIRLYSDDNEFNWLCSPARTARVSLHVTVVQLQRNFMQCASVLQYYVPAPVAGALSDDARLTSDVCRVHRA